MFEDDVTGPHITPRKQNWTDLEGKVAPRDWVKIYVHVKIYVDDRIPSTWQNLSYIIRGII